MEAYPATYADGHGVETTVIYNDGSTLRMTVRGVVFAGDDFDALEPQSAPADSKGFVLNHGCVCACRIELEMPISIRDHGRLREGALAVEVELGSPTPKGNIEHQAVRLALSHAGVRYAGPGTSGWFEDELLAIEEALPDQTHIRSCITCQYSDYSPYGHGTFGGMMCFRNVKAEYLAVVDKASFWPVHDRFERHVQETWLCPDFEVRKPDSGYRG